MRLIFVLKVCGKPLPALKAAAGTRGRRGSWRRSIATESVVRTAQAGCDATSPGPLLAKVPCGGGGRKSREQLVAVWLLAWGVRSLLRLAVQWDLRQRTKRLLSGRGIDCWGTTGTVNSVSVAGRGQSFTRLLLGSEYFSLSAFLSGFDLDSKCSLRLGAEA